MGICECERYCQGGKIVSGTTFRKHYSRNVRSSQDQSNPPPSAKSPLLENLAGIPGPSFPILLDWFREQGIWIHESLEIRSMDGGIAVYAVGVGSPQQVGE